MHADEFGDAHFGGELAFVVHRRKHTEAVVLAGHVVVGTVAGGDVHRAGAGVGGHEGGEDHFGNPVEKRVLRLEAIQLVAFERS